nr:MAG: hypothetical protein [Lokiarchaeota virus Ratatoskr Meg22_1012]
MVVNPDESWDDAYLAKIQVIEEKWAKPNGHEHICGHPTRNGTPCKRFPTDMGGKIINGRCAIHGGYPMVSHSVKAIVTKNIDFMLCDKCAINLEGRCEAYKKNHTCSIEAEIYQTLWQNLNAIYKFDDFPSQVMLDSMIRDYIRRHRAWQLENVVGIEWAIKIGVANYYERATEALAKWFDRLGMIKKSDKKTISSMMATLSKVSKK